MVLDPIPQPLPVHFFGSRPQPPTSPRIARIDRIARIAKMESCIAKIASCVTVAEMAFFAI